jgi:hypothetical protein
VRQGSLCYLLRVFLSILFVCSCQALRHLLCKFLGLISSMRSVFACTGGAQCRPVQAMAPPCPVPELQVWRGPYFSWPDPTSRIFKKTKSASPTTPSRPPAAVQRPYLTVPYLPPATPSSPPWTNKWYPSHSIMQPKYLLLIPFPRLLRCSAGRRNIDCLCSSLFSCTDEQQLI